ncbi:unnamed protein product [Camellia sinensis]
MPRSSRHKSHKQSKHSSREAREHSDSEEDVKMKDRSGKEEESVRVYRDSGLSEKRKLSLGKDLSGHGNGDTVEEYGSSKRRKEKADASAGSDRWNGGGDERGDGRIVEKETKGESSRIDGEKSSKSTTLIDLKSKSSKRHDGGSEKKEEKGGLVSEKEESKSSSRVDSKRKSEKDSGRKEVKDSKESKEKERGLEREKKIQEIKRETEAVAVGDEASRKQGSHLVDFGEERQGKRGRENTEWPIQDELRNPELEKELEKRIRRRRDGSNDKDKYEDDVKESEDRRLSLRGERAKDSRYKDEKRKDGSSGDKHREDGDRDNRNREDKYREDAERDSRHRDVKHREDGDGDNRHRDEKYHEDGERDNRHREDKYREDGDRDNRQRDNKYREDGDRDNRHRGDKYREDGDKDDRHRDDKYREDGDRDDRHRDDWYAEDGNRDSRNREEKNGEDIGRDGRRRDGKQREDSDKDKRFRDAKYRDERSSRDRSSGKSDIKRSRDESNAAELHYRKSNNHDGSPIYDDRGTRYKDDKGRRRTSDKEDHGDIRSRSTKEQHSDAGKKSISSARVESVSDRGRSNARNADVDITPNHSRRRNSPSSSSHAAKDHYRLSKQEESKYRDYAHEERVRHNVTSSKEFSGVAGGTEKASLSRSIEKSLQKDDSHLGELSADRRPKADARTSPLHVVDRSPSSTSTDRRHWNRSNIRRNLDVEDSGQKSGGSKDAKDYSAREGRGSRDVLMETLPGDELSQADGDNFSVSSPFSRTSHLSSNSRSLLPPPPPFRMGADSPVAFGSLEDDNRGKSNNRHRRIGDPNMGRVQGSPWRGIPNWPSPMANGFMPFQHGPPPVGFHPVMQQFRAPPMFGVRSSMELNQSGVPYHVPDGDRFSGHGRSLGWRNPVDDSCPPIHGWDGSSAIFGDESHMYGRLDWNHNRSLTGGRVWETSGDAWKGQNSGASTELPSAPQKEDYSARGPADDVWAGQSGLQAQNDKKQPSVLVESVGIDQSSDAHGRDTVETSKTILEEMPNLSRKDDSCLSQVYLSMLDISADLTHPELYSQYTSLMGMDQNSNSEEDDSNILFLEEAMDATVKLPEKTSSVSLFPTINDAVFQKAMSLYKKLREDVKAINVDKVPFSNVKNLESAPTLDQEVAGLDDDKQGEVVPACDQQEAEAAVSVLKDVKMEQVSPATTCEKIDEPVLVDSLEKSESSIAALNEENLELDLVSKQETLDSIVEDKSSDPENVELSEANSPSKVKEVSRAIGSNNDGPKLHDTKCGPSLFSDVSSEACEAVMPESIESTMVNLSRIHQSPESTH